MKIPPPKRSLKFLRWFCREDYIEEIEGDLVELFERRYHYLSPTRAKWSFTWDVIRSFRLRNLKAFGANLFNTIMIQHYIKIGGRNLLRNKAFCTINITGLSLGLTCCLVLFIFVRYESGFDQFHPYSNQTYRIVQHTTYPDQTLYWNTTAYPLAEALRNDFPAFQLVTQAAGPLKRFFTVEDGHDEKVQFESSFVLYVDPFYPKVFDLNWISGDQRTAFRNPNSIVLTERIAEKCFGETNTGQFALGRTVLLNGKDPMLVTGVVKDAPGNSNLRYEILVPYEFFKQNNPYPANNWSGNYTGTTFVVLPENHSLFDIESSIASWKKKYLNPEDDQRISYYLQPLKDIHTETLYGSAPGGYTMPGNIITAATFVGIFILLIAIANFINLVTANSVARAREVGIRKIIGSTRSDLFRQFTLENALLVIITIILSIGLSNFLLNQLNIVFSRINLQLSLQWSDTALALALGGLTILLGTLYPAVSLSAFRPLQIIKNDLPLGRTRGFSLRKSLTVFQFAIVQLFVIGAIVVAAQMNFFRSKELGFSSEAVVMVPVPQFDKIDAFKNSVLQNKDVDEVTIGSGPPMAINGFSLGTRFRQPDQQDLEGLEAEMKICDPGYLKFYNLELLSGRNFSSNKDTFDEFIVNERLIKSLGWTPEEAIGRKLVINEGEATIIGVTRDYHNASLQNGITPCILLNWNYFQDQAFVRIKNIRPEVLQSLEKTWRSTFTTSVFKYEFIDDAMANEYFVETLSFKGFTIFSIIVIVIGCLGLIGLMTFLTSRRTKEVGIRKVLGASVPQIIVFFSKEFVVLIVTAFVIALPFAYYLMIQWLEGFTYRIDLSWWMFLTGGIITLIIGILTAGLQAIKAAVVNPVESLRSE
jgi:ABC-type antimicrobial peptide transport system permease subunit